MTIYNLFVDNGFNVSIQYSNNIDEDFILMSNSKYFIPSGGGFSFLITKMVLFNNNVVL